MHVAAVVAGFDPQSGGGHTFEIKGQRRPASEIGASLAPIVAEFAA